MPEIPRAAASPCEREPSQASAHRQSLQGGRDFTDLEREQLLVAFHNGTRCYLHPSLQTKVIPPTKNQLSQGPRRPWKKQKDSNSFAKILSHLNDFDVSLLHCPGTKLPLGVRSHSAV